MAAMRNFVWMFCFILLLTGGAVGAFGQEDAPVADPGSLSAQEAQAPPVSAETLWQIILYAKWFMVVLGSLSVAGLFLVLYYAFTITEGRLIQREFLRKVYELVNHGNFVDAHQLCEKVDGVLPRILAAGLRRRDMGILAVSEGMAGVGGREMERYRQRVRYLSDIAAIAPMIGLLGTVWGMIEAFMVYAFTEAGQLDPGNLAASISKALITTGAGLVVAIPSMAAYYYFRGRLVRIGAQLEERAAEFAERLIGARTPRGRTGEGLR